MTILKAIKHKSCFSLGTCHQHVVQFIERTPTIYWYAKRNNLTFSNMPALNTIQQKQCSCIGKAMYILQTRFAQLTGQ